MIPAEIDLYIDQLIDGNCLEVMSELPPASTDLVFLDFPYTNADYGSIDKHEWMEFMNQTILLSFRVLKPGKSIVATAPWKMYPTMYILLQEITGLHPQNEVVWYYTRGIGQQRRFSYRHRNFAWFSKGGDHTRCFFNVDPVRVPYKYNKNVKQHPDGANPGDVWPMVPVSGQSRSRDRIMSQLPEALVCRFILSLTKEGDIVLDPMIGSGTTAVCAFHLGRRFIGIDIDGKCLDFATERLDAPFDGWDSCDVRSGRRPTYYGAKNRDLHRAMVRHGVEYPELEEDDV